MAFRKWYSAHKHSTLSFMVTSPDGTPTKVVVPDSVAEKIWKAALAVSANKDQTSVSGDYAPSVKRSLENLCKEDPPQRLF